MELAGVLIKTTKGVDEIQTRAYQLPQKKRYLLILVDGHSTLETLVAKFPTLGDIRQTLQELVTEGFLEIRGGGGAAAAAAANPDHQRFREAAAKLSRRLYDLIGPPADDFTGRLEGAQDRAGFLTATKSSVRMVESFAGKRKAEEFQQQAEEIANRFFK
jgi:hypothetical protein